MEKRVVISVSVIVIALIGILLFAVLKPDNRNGDIVSFEGGLGIDEPAVGTGGGEAVSMESQTYNIEITSSGFSPNSLTINSGDKVTWINKGSDLSWPASAIHPTHTAYTEIGGCIGSKFDACRGLAEGESFTFTFNEVGTWKYHDHLKISNTGTIVVN